MSAIDPAIAEAAQNAGPSCPDCGHLIGAHSHDVGCMDYSVTEARLERDRLGFCPCERSSLGLIADAVNAAESQGVEEGKRQQLTPDDRRSLAVIYGYELGLSDGRNLLRDGSHDESIGAVGETGEPLDPQVRDLSSLAYLVVTCESLGISPGEEWDAFMFARAIHRRVRAALTEAVPGE